MWKKLKELLLYAKLSQSQFNKIERLVSDENTSALKLASIVQIVYFGVSFISSLSLAEMANKRLIYGIGFIIPCAVLLLYFLLTKRHPAAMPWLIRAYSFGLLLTGLLCTLICTPDEMTLLLLIFMFCIPMVFVMRPIDLVLLALVTDLIYFIAAPSLKTHEVLTIDTIDIAIFSTLSVILGVSQMIGRYRRYWLETNAVELAQIRYQAAFMDQLTDTFNRNAYNRDTEKFNAHDISSDFMFISLDINGLKVTNDTFGHAAGDELVQGAAGCMKKIFSDYGKVYRVGGDEFIIIVNTKGKPGAAVLDEFNQEVGKWSGFLVHKLSVSYGVVPGNEAKMLTLHEIELLADQRMYQSKSDYYKDAGIDRRRR